MILSRKREKTSLKKEEANNLIIHLKEEDSYLNILMSEFSFSVIYKDGYFCCLNNNLIFFDNYLNV